MSYLQILVCLERLLMFVLRRLPLGTEYLLPNNIFFEFDSIKPSSLRKLFCKYSLPDCIT